MRSMFRIVAALALSLLVFGGCGSSSKKSTVSAPTTTAAPAKLFDTDFLPVCQGATQSHATPYVKTAATHKVLYFQTYKDALQADPSRLPQDWTVQFDPKSNAFAKVDLVACGTRTAQKFVRECGGYTDSGKSENDKVRVYTATYELAVREATTGKVLKKRTVKANNRECPALATFDRGETVVNSYATPSLDVISAFLRPFVQP